MTPKEKAQELIGKCYDIFINDEDEYYTGTAWRLSKECALMAVDELIKQCSDANSWYWEEVKIEINKL